MLDLVFVALTVTLFALVGLIARGIDRLTPRPRSSPPRDAASRGEQR